MNVIVKYARATATSNLKDDMRHHQAEPLAAVALADLNGIGSMLWRLKYALDASVYNRLLQEWTEIVKRKSIRESWGRSADVKQIAKLSLNHWVNDVCEACDGTGKQVHPDNSQLRIDDDCPVCNGSARRPLTCFKNQLEFVGRCVEVLESKERELGGRVIAKLAKDFEL